MKKFIVGFIGLIVVPFGISCGGCKKSNMNATPPANNNTNTGALIRFVSIGDSYTIGEGAKEPDEAWPTLLTKDLIKDGLNVKLAANPSRTGWTTKDVIDYELEIYDDANPDFATLLIGVNDWVQGVDSGSYHRNLTYILNRMQAKLANNRHLILVTIPDFSATPTGKQYANGRDISKGITQFNDIIKQEAAKRRLPVVDIFPLTQGMANDNTLIAKDGLHPSAKEYALWEQMIHPVAAKMLGK